MAAIKTIIKGVRRRRGTVSLTKVRQVVDHVLARHSASGSAKGKYQPAGKNVKATAAVSR